MIEALLIGLVFGIVYAKYTGQTDKNLDPDRDFK